MTKLRGSKLMPPVSHLGFVQYTSHPCLFGFLFIRLYNIGLAPFFIGVMKYSPSGEKYRQYNVRSYPHLNLPSGLDGVCMFIQILAFHSFYVVFVCFIYTLFQICI